MHQGHRLKTACLSAPPRDSLEEHETRALDLFLKISGERPAAILDLGCGDGTFLVALHDRAPEWKIQGFDWSEASMDESPFPFAKVVTGSPAERLPFESDAFDFVYMGDVIERLADPDFVLIEVGRVLKPGGCLVITTPNLMAWYNRLLVMAGLSPLFVEYSNQDRDLGRRLVRSTEPKARALGRLRVFHPDALVDLLSARGFVGTRLETTHFGYLPAALRWLDQRISKRWKQAGSVLVANTQKPRFFVTKATENTKIATIPAPSSVSVVIPTYNMAAYLEKLFDSIESSGLLDAVNEVLVVDDASTDQTGVVLEYLRKQDRFTHKLNVLTLPSNQGRFKARFEASKAARGEWLVFLDSRIFLPASFGKALTTAVERGSATVGWVDIDVTKNVFNLYWQRSHEFIFKNHYQHDVKGPDGQPVTTELTLQNYDRFLKGTGVFLTRRDSFLRVCLDSAHLDVKSDDTYLMKQILRDESMVIDPGLRIGWEPRSDYKSFLTRLWERGPGFVEYHVFQRQGLFFWIVLTGLILLTAWLATLVVRPAIGFSLGGLALVSTALSALAFSRSFAEWKRLAPLHVLVVLSFGMGTLYGLGLNTCKELRNWFERRNR